MANVWSGVTIDCLDPELVARFWSALLGREFGPSQEGWVYLGERGEPQPRLVFQPVSEPRTGKVRIHLDIPVDDIDEAMVAVASLGGRFTGERHAYEESVVVVVDGRHHSPQRSAPTLRSASSAHQACGSVVTGLTAVPERRCSRPTQVATHASLPSASARIHHIGACVSETRWPPAAKAAAMRLSA